MDSHNTELEKQIRILEDKLCSLKHDYSEQQKNLTRAAEIGKKLLDENAEMEERMQGQAKEHRKDIEVLEQEKYSLHRSLEHKVRMEADYADEIEGLKQSVNQLKDQMSIRAEAEYQQEISKLKNQVTQQQAEIDRLNLSDKQLRERNADLESQVDDVRQQLQQKVSLLNETCSEEMAQLHSDISNLQGEKLALLRELGDNKDQVQQLMLAVNSAREQLQFKDTEIEERACQATSYYNALEKSREENQELRAELDMLRLESQDQKTKGNSLFSEVEDRRVVAEKQLITLKVEYESLRKQYEASRQNHCRLRMQLAGLLHSSGGRADAEHLNNLQQQLSQKNDEVHMLMSKLHKYEKQGTSNDTIEDLKKMLGADKMDQNYVSYIQTLNEQKQRELSKVQEEIRTKSLQLLAESDKLMQCENKLYARDRQVDMYKGQNMKLQVQIEELQLKYEPEKLKTSKKIRKTVREQIPLSKSDQEQLMKTIDEQQPKPSDETNDKDNQESAIKKTDIAAGDKIPKPDTKGGNTSIVVAGKKQKDPISAGNAGGVVEKQQKRSLAGGNQSNVKEKVVKTSEKVADKKIDSKTGLKTAKVETKLVKSIGKSDSKVQTKVDAKPVKNTLKSSSTKTETKVMKSSLKTKSDKQVEKSDETKTTKVPLASKGTTNLTDLKDDTDLTDKNFKSMKKRKVTISDENEIVEPDSVTYAEENSDEPSEVPVETEGRLRGKNRCQKTIQVPRASVKLSEDPNECKNQ